MAVINCTLIDQIPAQLMALVEKSNDAEGCIPIDYPEDRQPKTLATGYIMKFVQAKR